MDNNSGPGRRMNASEVGDFANVMQLSWNIGIQLVQSLINKCDMHEIVQQAHTNENDIRKHIRESFKRNLKNVDIDGLGRT